MSKGLMHQQTGKSIGLELSSKSNRFYDLWFSKVRVVSCELRVGAKVHLKCELRVGFCELRVGFYGLLKRIKNSNSQKSTRIFDVQLVLLICNSHFWCSTRTFDLQLALLMFNSYFWCSTRASDVQLFTRDCLF